MQTYIHSFTQLLTLISISWSIKLLLIPAYFSTDFAVHQNWLRITSQLPISQWYYDDLSKWTLDYPPFFAYFEWILAKMASLIDPSIIEDINENMNTILFQRISVMVTDLVYVCILLKIHKMINTQLVIAYFSINFIILDNIHFQYNLLLQALFILSIYFMKQKNYILSALSYSTLLNFKHIYLYSAPAYFIYLLKKYIYQHKTSFTNLIKLAIVTLLPFALSFGPFFIIGGLQYLQQILSRLFPFQRGLVHQYWAPNFWAIYHFADKLLYPFANRIINLQPTSSSSGLRLLPDIPASVTIMMIVLFLLPLMWRTWKKQKKFEQLLCLSGLIFFTFGFHVHQKAITPYLNIAYIFTIFQYTQLGIFVNIVNLIPLLIMPGQKILSILLCTFWILVWRYIIVKKINKDDKIKWDYITISTVCIGYIIICYHLFIHPLINTQKIAFVPLMLNSVWAATFNILWISYMYYKYMID